MSNRTPRRQNWLWAIIVMLLWTRLPVAQAAPRPAATVQTLSGSLQVQRNNGGAPIALAERGALFTGDVVSTGTGAKATLLFDDGSQLRLNAGTMMELTAPKTVAPGKVVLFRLLRGEVFAQLRPGLAAQTRSATAAVRGTVFDLKTDENDVSTVVVIEGSVEFFNPFGAVAVGQSQQSVARPGAAPTAPVTVGNAGLIVEWTLDLNRAVVPREKYFVDLDRRALGAELQRRSSAAAANANDANTQRDYGDVLFDNGQFAEALKAYQDAERLAPTQSATLARTADAMLELNRLQEAEDLYRAALNVSPQFRPALIGLAWSALRGDRPEAAQTFAEQAVASNADSDVNTTLEAQVALGLALMRQPGKLDEAAKTFQTAATTAPDAAGKSRYLYQARAWLAMTYVTQDDQVAALREAQAATEMAPASSLAHGNLSLVYFFNNKPAEAVREATLASELNPQSVAARVALGQSLLAQDDADGAARSAAQAVALDPKLPQARYLLGVADAQRRDYTHAARELRESLRLGPTFLPAASMLARVYTRMGRNDDAVQLLTNLLPNYRNADAVQAALGEVYYEQGKYFESTARYNEAVKQRPNSALYAAGLARTLLDSNRLSEAIRAAQDAVRLAPEVGQYHAILGLAYDFSRISSQSEREYRSAIALDPQNALARAMIALKANDPATTVDTFTQAFLYDPAVSRQIMRGGISTELGPTIGQEGQRGFNLLNRDIFAQGRGHSIGGFGRSQDAGAPNLLNDSTSGSAARGDVTFVPRPTTNLYVNAVHARSKRGLSGFDSPFGFDPNANSAFGFNQFLIAGRQRIGRRNSLWVGLTHQTLHNDLNRSTQPVFLPFPLPLGTPFAFSGQNFQNRALIPEVRADFSLSREPSRPSILTLGLAQARLHPDLTTGTLALVNLPNPTIALPPLTSRGNERFSVAYAQLAQRFGDRLSLVAQLRGQRDRRTFLSSGGTVTPGTTALTQTSESHVLPGLVASFQPDKQTTLRFLVNSDAGTTNLALAPTETRLTLEPNILFRGVASTSRTVELDAEHTFSGNRFLKAFLFHATAKDLALGSDAPVYAFQITPPLTVGRMQQTGVGIRYEQALGRHLYGQASLLLNSTDNRTPGQLFNGGDAPYYPKTIAAFGLNYVDGRGNKATLIANHFGSFFADRPNFFGIPPVTARPRFGSHTYVTALLSRESTVYNEITIGVTNIFNQQSITFNSVPTTSDAFGTGRRRVFGGVTHRF